MPEDEVWRAVFQTTGARQSDVGTLVQKCRVGIQHTEVGRSLIHASIATSKVHGRVCSRLQILGDVHWGQHVPSPAMLVKVGEA